MSLIDDPQLTAFALGELEGQETENMKRMIENDPAAQKYVEEIQAQSQMLQSELKKEELPRLLASEREGIFEITSTGQTASKLSSFRFKAILGGALSAAAASVLMFTVYNPIQMSELSGQIHLPAPEMIAESPAAPPAEDPHMQPYQFEAERSAPEGNESQSRTRTASPKKVTVGSMSFQSERKAKFHADGESLSESDSQPYSGEAYAHIKENVFKSVKQDPLSTFSTDVDTASYANMRRFLVGSQLPPKDAVRIEEMLNYFKYEYPAPTGDRPFSVSTEVTSAPWNSKHQLVRIGLKGKVFPADQKKSSNLVFLVDVSGSMTDANKLPLLRNSLKLLVENMRTQDFVSIVTYAANTGVVLSSTSGKNRRVIMEAIDRLESGGGTHGSAGIQLAYGEAQKNFIKGGNNRVILATDGDFNLGMTSESDLVSLIQDKAKSGVFLSVLGFGMGNYKDSQMQKLANNGNGNHSYIDSLREARKVLVEESGGTLNTIAKDVKIQVEFNPAHVSSYRLIGYEKRHLNNEDFNDDSKDAGEIGEGHTVTALYEIVPSGVSNSISVDALKYQAKPEATGAVHADELMTVKLRYKKPDGDKSELISATVPAGKKDFSSASSDMKFAASLVGFGMILRDSEHKGDITLQQVEKIASENTQGNEYRIEFVELVKKARSLRP